MPELNISGSRSSVQRTWHDLLWEPEMLSLVVCLFSLSVYHALECSAVILGAAAETLLYFFVACTQPLTSWSQVQLTFSLIFSMF